MMISPPEDFSIDLHASSLRHFSWKGGGEAVPFKDRIFPDYCIGLGVGSGTSAEAGVGFWTIVSIPFAAAGAACGAV